MRNQGLPWQRGRQALVLSSKQALLLFVPCSAEAKADTIPSIAVGEPQIYHPLKHHSSNNPPSVDLQLQELTPVPAGRKAIAQRS